MIYLKLKKSDYDHIFPLYILARRRARL